MWYYSTHIFLALFECRLSASAGSDAVRLWSKQMSPLEMLWTRAHDMKPSRLGQNFQLKDNEQNWRMDVGLSCSFGLSLTNRFTADLGREWCLVMKNSRGSVDTMTYQKTRNCYRNTQSLSECSRMHVHHLISQCLTAFPGTWAIFCLRVLWSHNSIKRRPPASQHTDVISVNSAFF